MATLIVAMLEILVSTSLDCLVHGKYIDETHACTRYSPPDLLIPSDDLLLTRAATMTSLGANGALCCHRDKVLMYTASRPRKAWSLVAKLIGHVPTRAMHAAEARSHVTVSRYSARSAHPLASKFLMPVNPQVVDHSCHHSCAWCSTAFRTLGQDA